MKKFVKILSAVAAVSLCMACFGFTACGEDEDEGTSMTEDDVTAVAAAFKNAADNKDSYYIILNSYVSGSSTPAATGIMTYDSESGNFGYYVDEPSYGVDEGIYVIPQEDGSFNVYINSLLSDSYYYYSFDSVDDMKNAGGYGLTFFYYQSLAEWIGGGLYIDFEAAAEATTLEELQTALQEACTAGVSEVEELYEEMGLTIDLSISFNGCTVKQSGNTCEYDISYNMYLDMGEGITAYCIYVLELYAEDGVFTKMAADFTEVIAITTDSYSTSTTVRMYGTYEFYDGYREDVIPTDFSGYTLAE